MKRFIFRLETLLSHRKTLEELREQEFALAQGRHEQAKRELQALEAQYRQTIAERPLTEEGARFDAPALLSREKYVEALKERIVRQAERVEVARLIVEEKRLAMVAARQARESVTRLRSKDLAEYEAEAHRKTQEGLDEIASLQYGRQQAEASERRAEAARAVLDAVGAAQCGDSDERKAA
jgi:flagellar protein FliJ